MTISEHFVVRTLKDFINTRCSFAENLSLASGYPTDQYKTIMQDAKERCQDIGIEWHDDYMPEHVREILKIGEFDAKR